MLLLGSRPPVESLVCTLYIHKARKNTMTVNARNAVVNASLKYKIKKT